MAMQVQNKQPLIQIFGDPTYAWELLESQIRIETSQNINGEDVSHLLQLYMRGVQRMNSIIDIRESFFKNRVTSLMSRPTVIKILNKPMSKKNQAPIVQSSPVNNKKIDNKTQLQLKQKRKQIQMRLAYGAEQHNPDALKKLMAEQSQKQSFLTTKISKIVDDHEQRLMKRVKQRKLRTMTAKSRPDIYNNRNLNGLNGDMNVIKQMMQKQRDQQQFGKPLQSPTKKDKKLNIRKHKSMSPKRSKLESLSQSPTKRRVSMDFKNEKIQI